MRKSIFFLTCFVLIFATFAQTKDSSNFSFNQAEIDLKAFQKLLDSRDETARIEANKELLKLWQEVLSHPKSMDYPFDSLKGISRLTPHDKKFRIITWNLFKNDGSQIYFGFIQANTVTVTKKGLFKKIKNTEYQVYPLQDRSSTVKSPETYVSDHTKWYGMLYNGLIECDGYYILLGWDGNDKLTQKKFVDVLYFKSDGTPVFGKDVFKVPKKSPKRVMFEYSSEVAMSLRYNDHANQIVFSHLSPKSDYLEGQFQFYGPDGSFDAFEQSKDKWILKEDIDARNPKTRNDDKPKPDPKKVKDVYAPKK